MPFPSPQTWAAPSPDDELEGLLHDQVAGRWSTAYYAYGSALIRKDGEYPLFDGLGSERTVTNGSQTVTGTVNFDAFGNTVGTSGSSTNPYMFAAGTAMTGTPG